MSQPIYSHDHLLAVKAQAEAAQQRRYAALLEDGVQSLPSGVASIDEAARHFKVLLVARHKGVEDARRRAIEALNRLGVYVAFDPSNPQEEGHL